MQGFTGAFLGTIAAIFFVCAVLAFIAWREMKALEPSIKKRIDEKLDEKFGGADPSTVSGGGNYHPPEAVVSSAPDSKH